MKKKAALLQELQCQMELLKNLTALQQLRQEMPSPVEISSGPVGGMMDMLETMPMCLEPLDQHPGLQARLAKIISKHIEFFHLHSSMYQMSLDKLYVGHPIPTPIFRVCLGHWMTHLPVERIL